MVKEKVSYTLEGEVIDKVKADAEEENRSASFTVNRILEEYYLGRDKK